MVKTTMVSNHLQPEVVVVTIGSEKIVSGREHKKPPESPWNEVLNGNTPPELEDTFPPASGLTRSLGELGHGASNLSDTSHGNLQVPLSEAELAHAKRDNGTTESADNEENAEHPVDVEGRDGSEANDTSNNKRNPVSEGEDKDGTFTVLLHNFLSLIHPRDSEALEETEQKHKVNSEVVINDIKEGETPVEAEDN